MSLVVQKHENIEEYVESLKGLDIEALQLSPGRFGSHSEMLPLPEMRVTRRAICSASLLNAQLNKGLMSFTFPQSEGEYLVNGVKGDNRNIFLCRSDDEVVTTLPPKFHYAVVVLKEDKLNEYLTDDARQFLKSTNFALNVFSPEFGGEWLTKVKLQTYLNHLIQTDTSQCFEERKIAQDNIYSMLSTIVQHGARVDDPVSNSTRCRVVLRALDIIRENEGVTISTAELAKQSFCSVRTLQYAFSSLFCMTPLRYMQLRNMHKIRESLCRVEQISVKAVLESRGVYSEGRFSKEYQKHFGEYPKQTLKRAKAQFFN